MLPLLITLQYVNDGKNAVMSRLAREEKGATAVEYGLIVGLIAVAIVGVLVTLGPQLRGLFQTVQGSLPGAPAPA
ncbi:Flp family type IVb pilin [Kocuria flava]|uniref:Flp family type IVb pilin n=1 Tax=Kocuria flava TaxID=446860 RepID=UPI001FF4101B|nr:Flp family type IVb pilin [Kocuria flava]MCJ8503652.1 Flp family type IVb pilin [Kocuria flava]